MYTHFKLQRATTGSAVLSPTLSLSHFLANMECYEFGLEQDEVVHFQTVQTSFSMIVIRQDNFCQLGYYLPGTQSQLLQKGHHQIMIVIFRPEWFIYKCQSLPKLMPLIRVYENGGATSCVFPPVSAAAGLLRNFDKVVGQSEGLKKDKACYLFLDDCINKYQKLIEISPTSKHHQLKAAAIARFIDENYASSLVDHAPDLAARFMVSERHLYRLAKIAFGIPLHAQIIKIRMNYGITQLLTSNMPVRDIARQIGYNEPCYFSKAFKKYFGVSPREMAGR
jgi:AraC-like DNA-binding protein